MDSSTSIGTVNFQRIKRFLQSFIEGLDIGSDKVRVGLAQYSHRVYREFLLKDHTDKRSLVERVDRLLYRGGGTFTGKGIKFLQSHFLTKEAGSRADEGVPQVVVVMTDGASQDDVVGPSLALKEGVKMFAIGVGNYNYNELESIVSQPHEQYLIELDSYQALQGLGDILLRTMCISVSEPESTPDPDPDRPGKLLSPSGRDHILALACLRVILSAYSGPLLI